MLTYVPPEQRPIAVASERPWLLLLLCAFWLVPGLLGHDPWKPDEPQTLGMVLTLLKGQSWALPMVAGLPVLETPPLYPLVAAGCAWLFSPWLLPVHDAARLATLFFMAGALWCAGLAGHELWGRRHGRSVVLILMGTMGLLVRGHELISETALFFGHALAIYSFALALRRPVPAGILLGTASSVIFLSSSLLGVLFIWGVAAALFFFKAWRTRGFLLCLGGAAVIAIPWSVLWPWALYRTSPEHFSLWLHFYAFGPFRGWGHLSFFHEAGYYLKMVPWYAWPAWPLALWGAYINRARLNMPVFQLSTVLFCLLFVELTFLAVERDVHALPLLLPLALVGATGLDALRRGAAAGFNWFGLLIFGSGALILWMGWVVMVIGWPTQWAFLLRHLSPHQAQQIPFFPFLIAVLMTGLWIWGVIQKRAPARQALSNWAGGATLVWGLAMTLWLPWLDGAKSYRSVVQGAEVVLSQAQVNCVRSDKLDLPVRALFYYFSGRKIESSDTPCTAELVQFLPGQPLFPVHLTAWQLVWQGQRPGDERERFQLFIQSEVTAKTAPIEKKGSIK